MRRRLLIAAPLAAAGVLGYQSLRQQLQEWRTARGAPMAHNKLFQALRAVAPEWVPRLATADEGDEPLWSQAQAALLSKVRPTTLPAPSSPLTRLPSSP